MKTKLILPLLALAAALGVTACTAEVETGGSNGHTTTTTHESTSVRTPVGSATQSTSVSTRY